MNQLEERPRHNNLNLILGFMAAAMVTTSHFKNEIEPYRAAARETLSNLISFGSAPAQAKATSSPAPVAKP